MLILFIIKTETFIFFTNSPIKRKAAGFGFGFGRASFRSAPMVQRKEAALDAAYMMNDMEESEPTMPDMEHATAEVYIPSLWGFLIS